MNQQQIEAVSKLPGEQRYSHSIKVIADRQEAWGLYSNGWALAGSSEGRPIFPIWPRREFAAACATGEWSEYIPKQISKDELLNALLPSLRERGTLIGVFYTSNDKGVIPDLDVFEADVREELSQFE